MTEAKSVKAKKTKELFWVTLKRWHPTNMDQEKYKQSRAYIEDYLDERLGYPVEINRELYVTGAPKT